MTIYLVPCGVSILGNMESPNLEIRPEGFLDLAALATVKSWALTEGMEPEPGVAQRWAATWPRVSGSLHLVDWRPEVSAELSTLARRMNADEPRVDETHRVILLASETVDGLLAAFLNATYLTGGDAGAIGYRKVPPGSGVEDLRDFHVLVVTIAGLRPHQGDGFREAARGIGTVMHGVHDVVYSTSEPVEVHLTGGYKPILLHTMTLAEVLRSKLGDRAAVTAWYLAQEDSEIERTEPDQIGLRLFKPEALGLLTTALACVAAGVNPGTTEYLGIAWDESRGGLRLNAFGEGFRAILGEPRRGENEPSARRRP